ncbi:MAG: quinolinate synthase NadA [Nitrospinota bacterium]|nr:quinolinate synthase NadA [Nitrospinota bacterium]
MPSQHNDIIERIKNLKEKKKAVILAHNYQINEVQLVADYIGDSLGLSIQAAKTEADMIIFCGVYFMAETAKILSPNKKVIIPDKKAGCPMADMINAKQLRELKVKHPKAKVLCYVNTSAEVKAECDLCCTSSNAARVVEKGFAPNEEIIFVPDKYLANYTSKQIGRDFIVWDGYCPTHARILADTIKKVQKAHPKAKVIVHPECRNDVAEIADAVLSTGGMYNFVRDTEEEEIIVGTEVGMIERLRRDFPKKKIYPASDIAVCPNMKKTTLEKVLWALEEEEHEVIVDKEIADKARGSIERMIAIG